MCRLGGDRHRDHRLHWMTWWLWRGDRTRSHPELGRENPQRPWYCGSSRGRVGRRQVFQCSHYRITNAGWSSPVARQAHNLKVTGSNPVPATRKARQLKRLAGFWLPGPGFQKIHGSTVEARRRVIVRVPAHLAPRWRMFRAVTKRRPIANRSAGMAPGSLLAARTSVRCGIGHRAAVPPPCCRMVCLAGCHRQH